MNNLSTFQKGRFVLAPLGMGMTMLTPRAPDRASLLVKEEDTQPSLLRKQAQALPQNTNMTTVPQMLPNRTHVGAFLPDWAPPPF
jgi:hypothetical protein